MKPTDHESARKAEEERIQGLIAMREKLKQQRIADDASIASYEQRKKVEAHAQILVARKRHVEEKQKTITVMSEAAKRQSPVRIMQRAPESPIGIYFLNLPISEQARGLKAEGRSENLDTLSLHVNGSLLQFVPGQELTVEKDGQHVIDALFNEGYPVVPVESQEHLIQLKGSL